MEIVMLSGLVQINLSSEIKAAEQFHVVLAFVCCDIIL